MPKTYKQQWNVIGTSGKIYKVSLTFENDWECGCQAWTMQKKEKWVKGKRVSCQHILQKQLELAQKHTPVVESTQPSKQPEDATQQTYDEVLMIDKDVQGFIEEFKKQKWAFFRQEEMVN